MKITGSKVVAVTGVPPVTPVVRIDNEQQPRVPQTYIKQLHTAGPETQKPQPDVILLGRLGENALPPVELYGPDGKIVGATSASGMPRGK